MLVKRFAENPIITPVDVPPSRPDFEVVCAFNAGVTRYHGEILLLLRVAERPRSLGDGIVRVPVLDCAGSSPVVRVYAFDPLDASNDCRDPRIIIADGTVFLTTLSHLRLARSTDGRHFTVDPTPALFPDSADEAYGLEDPRITEIDGVYYIVYKSVAPTGISVSLAVTRDFLTFDKKGLIFAPENLDVCLFPEKIDGHFIALHRPVSRNIAGLNIWSAASPDLLHWGGHHYVMGTRAGMWDNARIGGSAIPIKTERGWLEIYHGATPRDVYCLGAVLLDLHAPHHVLARSTQPLMQPEAPYETAGFLPNVLFSCGALVDGDMLTIYYGAADWVMAGAELSISEILDSLEAVG